MENKPAVYRFQAVLERFNRIGSSYYITFPYSVEEEYGTKGLVRIKGLLNGVPMNRSLIPNGDGTHYMMLSQPLCKKAKLALGQTAQVELQHDDAPREARVPEELEAAFELEPEARKTYHLISPGMQRNICAYIDEAKRPETRTQRALMMLDRLLTGYFHAGRKTQLKKEE